ncbi:hypothetical protein BG006_002653 [Podila minutissima]|uniref:Large-conductance mechanosensitive channel n=1 Tax=Podila minutissima TaxID=64525 RepID=A0A9P5VNM7_9FUNG|nr:hypothetical protein BG006_002653 [Podila minutissima]
MSGLPRNNDNNTDRGRRERIIYELHNAEGAARQSLLHGGEVVSRKAKTLWSHFIDFIDNGNVIGLAVGLMLGATFTSLVNSLINDIFSPPLGIALGKASLENLFMVIQDGANTTMHYLTLEQGKENVIDQFPFCGGANVVFQNFQQEEIIKSKVKCKFCRQKISKVASRCQFCTSWQDEPRHVQSPVSLTGSNGYGSRNN